MKHIIKSSIAAMMVFGAGQASAADFTEPSLPSVSSVMSIYGGGAVLDSDDAEFDEDGYFIFGGDARVAGESWLFEIAGAGHTTTDDNSSSGHGGGAHFSGAGHWLSRSQDNTWGLFGALAHTEFADSDDYAQHVFGGLEFAGFGAQSTWFAQAGGVVCVNGACSDTWEAGGFGRVGFRYFPTDDQKFEIDFMGGFGNFDDDNDVGFTAAWGAEYEQQLSGPFSWFVAYRGHFVEDSTDGTTTPDAVSHAGLVGFRVDVGAGSLRQRDVEGAGTFNMPDLFRAFAWPDEL
ncbi:hypothetical protein [Anderseniella sp. Alg231-50]|uniref:hypothetical protein n=1 Tax=Anderseniella sp. Alg231-50 TaxID=1922226 RepID=UPI00307C051C